MNFLRSAAAAGLAALTLNHALALDLASAITGDRLFIARAQIADKQWASALQELRRLDDTGDANWNNLMGYSLRKSKTPDYAEAERYYDAALRIDPTHRGALQYSGELYLTLGNLAKAQERLAALNTLCAQPCTEQAALAQAIEEHVEGSSRQLAAQSQ